MLGLVAGASAWWLARFESSHERRPVSLAVIGCRRGLALALALAGTPAVGALAAQGAVPVYLEPRHRLVHEDGPVRILDVEIAPGDTSLYHIHDPAILYVPVATAPIDAQTLGGPWAGVRPGAPNRFVVGEASSDTLYVARPVTHRVANVGTSPFHLIAILSDGFGGSSNRAAPDADEPPGEIGVRSSWFLQTRVTLAPGASTGWHTTALRLILVQPRPGRITAEFQPAGASRTATDVLDGAGSWSRLARGTRYRVRNDGSSSATVMLIQVQ